MASLVSSIVLIIVSIAMSFFRQYKPFKQWFASKVESSISSFQSYPSISLNYKLSDSPNFTTQQSLKDIAKALNQLSEFKIRALRQNGVVYQRTKKLQPNETSQLSEIGYFDKIETVNYSIEKNYTALIKIIEHTLRSILLNNEFDSYTEAIIRELGYTWNSEDKTLVRNAFNDIHFSKSSNQHRVNEAMCHIVRDWSDAYDIERKPLLDFIESSLSKCKIDNETLIVVPGSGCGRISYEIAKNHPEACVDSIELSSLMYICNEFALGSNERVTIDPFYQYYSGQNSVDNQSRDFQIDMKTFKKPENLQVHYGDFCSYTPTKTFKNIIVCTAFFIDTAENLFSYLDAIELISRHTGSRLHWINIGPLKYGTRPLVQLTYQELLQLRKIRGWKDHASIIDTENLNGYLTDYESLYQGFYGLVKFHSELQK